VFHISIWGGLEFRLAGLSPTKPPVATELHSMQILRKIYRTSLLNCCNTLQTITTFSWLTVGCHPVNWHWIAKQQQYPNTHHQTITVKSPNNYCAQGRP